MRRRRRRWTVGLALLLWWVATGLWGCSAPRRPQDVVRDYFAAIARGDVDAAWTLLATDADVPAGDFATRLRGGDAARGEAWAATARVAPVSSVEATWARGDAWLVVARTGGSWVLRDGLLGLYPQDTPESALRSFVAAYRRGRFDVLHALAPPEARRQLSVSAVRERLSAGDMREVMEPRVAALETALPHRPPFERSAEDGDRAVLAYGTYRAVVVRRGEAWFVEDL